MHGVCLRPILLLTLVITPPTTDLAGKLQHPTH